MSHQDPYQQHPGTGGNPPAPNPYGQIPETPAQPPYGQPTYGQYGQPAYGQPAYGQPAPTYGQPAPTYGQPAYGQPVPAYGAPAVPTYGTPSSFGTATYGTATYGAPYANPGFGFVGMVSYASWGQRVGAYLLDALALLPYLAGLLVMTVTSEPGLNQFGEPVDQATSTGMAAFGVGAVVSFVLWAWNRWVRGGRTGQSWGKKAVGLTMQRDVTGEPLGVWMALVRDVAHYVDGILYLGYLWPLWDGKRQTFSDKLTKSVVVR